VASTEYNEAAADLGRALQECQESMLAVPSSVDRRRLRIPDECWQRLHQSVTTFTRLARQSGEFPEHALVRIKQLTSDMAPSLEHDSPLREAIIRLCIREYFTDGAETSSDERRSDES